ncbi:helix-turn-helix domain-containing protein [Bradyrhizobium liaoningense]|uniref:helix-turn-helix domain-containing protein n=1 Tax=Bradyrhizobium liaoningense TaxID=43992 RepID=UPI001BA50650|nr:helix-turn-helix domain-containing protein [Bradyrhizobium liaoningense]MBR0713064.1 helix-turn-helix domain-containing protein [Bradyrhizobium liaoningense]
MRFPDPSVLIKFEDRESDSPYVERVWRSRSRSGGFFLSMAEGNIELVVTRLPGFLAVTLRGPVTKGTLVECPPNGEWVAIRFRLGTYLPQVPTAALIDHQNIQLPVLPDGRFLFSDSSWEIPSYDNAESLVARLARAGVIARSHATDAAVEGDVDWMSQRSTQRHFRRVTGMTFSSYQQIQRARRAATLLVSGSSVLDATLAACYFDQAHLTRSVKQLIGMTPARLARERPQLSFSYKTTVS